MTTLALYVPLHAQRGREDDIAESLRAAVPLVNAEPGTVSWFAIQEGPSRFGIFETFDDETGRDAHLNGPAARALMDKARSGDWFEQTPEIRALEVLANKLPKRMNGASGAADLLRATRSHINVSRLAGSRAETASASPVRRRMTECAVYIPLQARLGREEEVIDFLRSALPPLVHTEPDTVAWFALQEGRSRFAILGTFADEVGRNAHFNGKVRAALMEHSRAGALFVGMPEIRRLGILAGKLPD
jgi:quinol monooxygenase YgiN